MLENKRSEEDIKRDIFQILKALAENERVIEFITNEADPFGYSELFAPYRDRDESSVDFATEKFKISDGQLIDLMIWTTGMTWRKFAEIIQIPYLELYGTICGRVQLTTKMLDALEQQFPSIKRDVWVYLDEHWTDGDAEDQANREFNAMMKSKENADE